MYSRTFTCEAHGEAHPCPHGCSETDAARTARLLEAVRDGAWLDEQRFPPLRWAVHGLIPEGFTLLVGPPKVGKSWLTLGILLSIACGGKALGRIPVVRRRVLYLALEDGDRRMQSRCRTLMGSEPLPDLYSYVVRVAPHEVLATIDAFLDQHDETALVVIDTLGKVMPPALQGESTYQRDYRIGGRLKTLADSRPGLSLVVVHHDRKSAAEDFVERVSGTNGLAGAADTIVVLSRARHSTDGTLAVTGRDVDEGEYALTVSGGSWVLDGANLSEAAARQRDRADSENLADDTMRMLRMVEASPDGVTATAIAAELGMTDTKARTYLNRLVSNGRIARLRRGWFGPLSNPVSSVSSVMNGDDDHTVETVDTHDTHITAFEGDDLDDVPLWDDDGGEP